MATIDKPSCYPLVGIIGSMATSGEPGRNLYRAAMQAKRVWDMGGIPWFPHTNWIVSAIVPEIPISDWKEIDKGILLRCDFVYRLPGESVGADEEERFCESFGIPVFHEQEGLKQAIKEYIKGVLRDCVSR